MKLIWLVLLGILAGHLVRRLTPFLMGMKDKRLPFRWPWVEVGAAILFAAIGWVRGPAPDQWAWFVLTVLLLFTTASDALCKYISPYLCYGGALAGLALSLVFPEAIHQFLNQESLPGWLGIGPGARRMGAFTLSVMGAAMGFLQMEFIAKVFKPLVQFDVMGRGDGLLMMMAGAFVGPQMVLFSLFPACLVGILMGVIWKWIHGTPHFPFGPALGIGALVMVLFGPWVIRGITGFHGLLYALPPLVLLVFSLLLVLLLLFLILRLKKKAAQYERMIEEDYRKIDEKMES